MGAQLCTHGRNDPGPQRDYRFWTWWSSVLDLIYNERVAFGFGIRSRPEFHVDCDLTLAAAAADCAWRHPHNLYVSTMFYGGVFGIGGLILLMMISTGATLESNHPARWLTLSLLTYGFAVLMFDGNRLISKIDFIWLVFWLPLRLRRSSNWKKG